MGIFARKRKSGTVYYVSFMWKGDLQQERAGTDRRAAERLERKRKREVAAGTYHPERSVGRVTLAAYGEEVIQARRARGDIRSIEDEATRFRLHILPRLGAMRLDEVRPRDVRDFVLELKKAGDIGAKTIVNVHSVLMTIFEAAVFEELIPTNPARRLPKGTLPKTPKKHLPPFTREEVGTLLTDERIDGDRRVLYALLGLTGMRLGEGCGRRWRDIDAVARPLHMLTVDSQYDDRPLKTAKDEDTQPRQVPIHPELARILADWKLRGFAETFGRHPKPNDFIVPDPRTSVGPRTKSQAGKALYRDLEAVGIPSHGTHAFRRFFISYARTDGARVDVLERVTHNARGETIDGYTYFGWEALCEAVSCLRVDLRRGEVVTLPKVASAAGGSHDAPHDVLSEMGSKWPEQLSYLVEAPGVELVVTTEGARNIGENGVSAPTGHTPIFPGQPKVSMQSMTRVMRLLDSAERKLRAGGHDQEAEGVALARAMLKGLRGG